MKKTTQPKKRKFGPAIPGICADAKTLGVTRHHLWRVLHGQRESISLKKRYADLQAQKKKEAAQ